MSLNKAMNATIALIEDRSDIAKEILRAPESDVRNISELQARLEQAVNRAAARAIRNVLKQTLGIHPNVDDLGKISLNSTETETVFYLAVNKVESLFEERAKELEA